VEQPALVTDAEREDRQPFGIKAADDLDPRVPGPRVQRAPDEAVLERADPVGADGVLQLEHEAGADRLDDRGRAALFAVNRIAVIPVAGRRHERDGAAAGDGGNTVPE
jgi:hypothetical protein